MRSQQTRAENLQHPLVLEAAKLGRALGKLKFSDPVAFVYNTFDYALEPWCEYVEQFGNKTPRTALLLGMNPGPWGMAQTGIPFGEVGVVRDWIGIQAQAKPPQKQHPKRPIEGFACTRSEVSGARLWGWAQEHFATPEKFFHTFFVANYCPLAFLEEGGRNRTPDKLPSTERDAIEALCDDYIASILNYLEPEYAIGVGQFAEKCLTRVAEKQPKTAWHPRVIARILHPSPASPAANRGWAEQAESQLREIGIKV